MKKILVLVFIFLTTVQCAEDPLNKNVEFDILPNNPIVIDADYTYTRQIGDETKEITVKGPWFLFSYTIKNNSDRVVTLASIRYTVEAISKTGNTIVSKGGSLDPGELEGDPTPTVLARVPPGGTYGIDDGERTSARWIIHTLPEKDTVRSLAFKVKFEAIGWFEEEGSSSDRIGIPSKTMKKQLQITTQF